VEGVPVKAWVEKLLSIRAERPTWRLGDTLEYQVLRDGRSLVVEVPLAPLPWRAIIQSHWGALLFAFVSQVVAGFVYLRRREDPAARALFVWAFSGSHVYAWSVFLQAGDIVGGTGFWLFRLSTPLLWLVYWPASTHVALVFPRPLSIVRYRPFVIPALYISSFTIFSLVLAYNWTRADGLLAWMNTWGPVDNLIAAIYLAATMVAIVFQNRRPLTILERRQIRWVVFGALASGLGGLLLWIGLPLLLGREIIDANLLGLISLPFPVALALAIWRHRLFDIDVIIRRTLQYSILTLLLAGCYFGAVVLLQDVFQALTGRTDSPLVTVLSTLAIAALFNPLRVRVQAFIDRRFYRSGYDAEQILAEFAATARHEVDLEALSVALLGAVDESMQPDRILLCLRPVREVKVGPD